MDNTQSSSEIEGIDRRDPRGYRGDIEFIRNGKLFIVDITTSSIHMPSNRNHCFYKNKRGRVTIWKECKPKGVVEKNYCNEDQAI